MIKLFICKEKKFLFNFWGIIEINHFSSSNLSWSLLPFLICWSLSKVNSLKIISSSARTQDTTTNVSLELNSRTLRSIITFGMVSPWLLWTVIAQASRSGSCVREQVFPDLLIHATDSNGFHSLVFLDNLFAIYNKVFILNYQI